MDEHKREICPGCKAEIDPEVCGCGDSIDHSPWQGHSPIAMGCNCGREPEATESASECPKSPDGRHFYPGYDSICMHCKAY